MLLITATILDRAAVACSFTPELALYSCHITCFIPSSPACFVTGIGLEIAYHSGEQLAISTFVYTVVHYHYFSSIGSDDILRGFVFVIVAAVILLPSSEP